MREIITLQLGHSANFVGTHFWNQQHSQESADQAVLFRPGQDLHGSDTWTPRLVIADLKGSFAKINTTELHEEPMRETPQELQHVVRYDLPQQNITEYQKYLNSCANDQLHLSSKAGKSFGRSLMASVNVWADFNSLYYSPQTFIELATHTFGDKNNRFAKFTRGREVYKELDMATELIDERIRRFMEESDSAQGFQVMADINDGFSGFAAEAINEIMQEYSKKSVFVFGIQAPDDSDPTTQETRIQSMNRALFMSEMMEASPVYIPLKAPKQSVSSYITQMDKPYAWSAILAAGIDTATMPFRLGTQNRLDMGDMQRLMNPSSSTGLSALSLSFPLPISKHSPLSLSSQEFVLPWMHDLTLDAVSRIDRTETASMTIFRGMEFLDSQSLQRGSRMTVTECKHYIETMTRSFGCRDPKSCIISEPFNIPPTFPQFFTSDIGYSGMTDTNGEVSFADVESVSVFVRIHNGPQVDPLLRQACQVLSAPRKDSWLANEYSSGDYGIDRSEWAAKSCEIEEYFHEE